MASEREGPLLTVTLYGRPVGKAYAEEILDEMASWCPGLTSRKRKRKRCKERRRERLARRREARGGDHGE